MDDIARRLEQLRSLTPREREVLSLVCQVHGYQEIGTTLFVTERTVLFHMGNIYTKLSLVELPRGARQRELGLFCPVLAYLEEATEPESASGATATEEPPQSPGDLALAVVREDALAVRPSSAVEKWEPSRVLK